ncbi:hypothetical protein [Curtobacterium sp. BH-2-1-1]|nr:hypothetical protein [Curtobacterium sp. BH-2-1-1]
MASQNDELSSHRTRTNRRPEPVPLATVATGVIADAVDMEVAQAG